MGYVRIEPEAGGVAFSIRQDWTDARENGGREGRIEGIIALLGGSRFSRSVGRTLRG